jgi:hypothetical protein
MMEPLDPNAPLAELFSALCDGRLNEQQQADLAQRLADDPQAQAAYLRYCRMHAELRLRARSSRTIESFKQLLAAETQAAEGAVELAHPEHLRGRRVVRDTIERLIKRPTPFSMTVAAAVVGLLITAMYLTVPPIYRAMTGGGSVKQTDRVQFVAQLTSLREAVWGEGQVGAHQGAFLRNGHRMDLRQGLVEITYRSGAKVILEGPAQFTFGEHNEGSLTAGSLAALVPPEASGFRVSFPCGGTPAQVIDRGTEFAIAVEGDAASEVHVFQGLVDLVVAGRAQRLATGSAVVVTPTEVRSIPSNEKRFTRELPASVIPVVQGDIQFLPEPPFSVLRKTIPRSSRMYVFVERRGVTTSHATQVSFAAPGEYRGRREGGTSLAALPEGTQVDSYFVTYSPNAPALTFVEGEVRFPRPIVGVMLDDPEQIASDRELGSPALDYDTERALEEEDVVTLSGDRRTLRLRLGASHPGADQLRVLTESSAVR